MTERKQLEVSDILLHYNEHSLPYNAVVPPLVQTSIYSFNTFDEFRDAMEDESKSFLYSRGNNPTVNLCEEKIAALEHADKAKLVSSGVAAISSAIMPFVESGDHCIVINDCYCWTRYILSEYLSRFGVTVTFVEGVKVEDFEKACQKNTKIIYLESPATFTFKLQPLKEIAEFAKSKGIKTIIDNTWATPIFQNPIDYGIDLVIHSASKYLGGNSDLVGGVIAGSEEDLDRIFKTQFLPLGPVPDPFMAWLILRNLRSLAVRMPVHYKNALGLATYLESRSDVEEVLYPMLPSFSQYELARKQLRGGSGLFSFRLKTRDVEKIKKITDSVHYFKKAVSWGGYESLFDPSAANFKKGQEIPDDRVSLVRVHAGLEDLDLLIEDLGNALDAVK